MSTPANQTGFDVRVDQNGQEARLVLSGQADPEALSLQAVLDALKSEKVVVSATVQRRVEEAFEVFRADPKPVEHVVAEARPPHKGADGYLAWEVGPEADNGEAEGSDDVEAANGEGEARQVDHYNQHQYICVNADQHIATVMPPEPGVDGEDIFGQPIPSEEGKPFELKVDDTVLIDQAGRVHAQVDGVVDFARNELKIIRLLEIRKNVDFSTGNIDFDGTVTVNQGVRDRFVVKATEDVNVYGLIEAATIVAGGNFSCARGMAAKDRGQLLIDGDAEIGFMNNVRGRIRGSLNVRREVINCELIVGGDLNLEYGALIGGQSIVTGSANIGTLGSDGDTPTVLVLGAAPLVSSQLTRLDGLVKAIRQEIDQLQDQYDQLARQGDKLAAEDKEKLTELAMDIEQLQKKLDACERKRQEIFKEVGAKQQVDVFVNKMVHPKSVLKVGGREIMFERELRGPVKIGWNENREIQYRQGDGPTRSIRLVAREMDQAA